MKLYKKWKHFCFIILVENVDVIVFDNFIICVYLVVYILKLKGSSFLLYVFLYMFKLFQKLTKKCRIRVARKQVRKTGI